jgi:hypothetical protein
MELTKPSQLLEALFELYQNQTRNIPSRDIDVSDGDIYTPASVSSYRTGLCR